MYIGRHVKCSLFLAEFSVKLVIFSTDIRKTHSVITFCGIRPVGAYLLHADGLTDMTKLLVAFRNFANSPKNCHLPEKCTCLWILCDSEQIEGFCPYSLRL